MDGQDLSILPDSLGPGCASFPWFSRVGHHKPPYLAHRGSWLTVLGDFSVLLAPHWMHLQPF